MTGIQLIQSDESYILYGAEGTTYSEVEVQFDNGKFNGKITYMQYTEGEEEPTESEELKSSNFYRLMRDMAIQDYKRITERAENIAKKQEEKIKMEEQENIMVDKVKELQKAKKSVRFLLDNESGSVSMKGIEHWARRVAVLRKEIKEML